MTLKLTKNQWQMLELARLGALASGADYRTLGSLLRKGLVWRTDSGAYCLTVAGHEALREVRP